MNKYYTAIVETYEQTGPDTYNTVRYSRNFADNRTLAEVVVWAKTMLEKDNIKINDINFYILQEIDYNVVL